MKYLLASVGIVFSLSSIAMEPSQVFTLNKPMRCAPAQAVFDEFSSMFGETPLWVGKEESSNSYITLLSNKDTGSWTMIQYDSTTACVLGSGKSGTPI